MVKVIVTLYVYLDIDECSTKHSCSHICHNVNGFYQCFCSYGYKLNDDRHTCRESMKVIFIVYKLILQHNISYMYSGKGWPIWLTVMFMFMCYLFQYISHAFISVQNPCLELSNLNCSHYCVVDEKIAKCQCENGFSLANDNHTCLGMILHLHISPIKRDIP